MRYSLIVFILLLKFSSTIGQIQAISVNTMPLSTFNRLGRVRIGTEVATNKFIYCLDIELGNEKTSFLENSANYDFFGARPEIQFLANDYGTVFVALEVPVTVVNSYMEQVTFESLSGTRFTVDNATKKRNRISLIFKGGKRQAIGSFGYVSGYLGFGVVRREVEYQNQVNPVIETRPPTEEWGSSSDETPEGIRLLPEFALGLKIGVYLYQKR